MLQNYFKIAWRNLAREKGYAFINIAGLAIGMAAAMLIFLWIQNELAFDRFYPKTKRLFQVYNRDIIGDKPQVWGATPAPLAPALIQDYPEVEDAARYRSTNLLLAANDKFLNIEGCFADPGFLNLFDLPLHAGNRDKALAENSNIIITRSLAEKLFGTTDVLGKTIRIERKDNLMITAVLDNIPSNSSFKAIEYILPWNYSVALGWTNDNWNNNNYYTYVLLDQKANAAAVNDKIKHATVSHLKGIMKDPSHREIFLNPADKWHLYSKEENGQLVDGRIVTVRLFGIIAAFILLIACVNFINLSTARSDKRAKEVGIRKVAGAPKLTLVFQFISESVILSFLAGIVAFAIVWAFIPSFNTLINTQLSPDFTSFSFLLPAFAFVLLTGIFAGSYPAFFLANFQPLKVMKGTYKSARNSFSPRKGLVVLQFTFAIILIISTLIIKQQISHAQNRNSGYDKNNLIFSYLQGNLSEHYAPLQQELLESGAVSSISKSIGPITQMNTRQWGVSWPGSTQKDKDQEFVPFGTDIDFLKTNGVKLVAGREIDIRKYPSDSLALMLNESAVKAMRLNDPIGVKVKFSGKEWNVVGVVKDFIFASPYDKVNPVLVYGPARDLPWTSMRLNPAKTTAKNLEIVHTIFKKHNPEYPFEYTFADESYQAKFAEEQRTSKLTGIFTGLTIFISCLGLFGLAAFSAQQRTKEIGVRKVLGASVASIIQMLSTEFVKLVLIAFFVALPIAWYAMDQWLKDYNYRILIEWHVFAITLLLTIMLVLVTVTFQAINAALMNPVKSLKVD
ncbi:ABC transporter permease [Dyadobacter sp. LJ53]|uniref:ABC transporter permease n=1 Tax=Dyadobacter chenwenxiniae TaxID=2906456 RepID=UPI001F341E4E|nr:ABC transporter permease [Dyadobacter chenwenxiniae]MCF0049101.1 ABC transporter permease [Dyadobacter chenwenxiniae]